MDYKQKYEEALKKAKDMLAYKEIREEDIEYLFPELKQSEDDKIRNWIIAYLDNKMINSSITIEKENLKKAISWLYKQEDKNSITEETIEIVKKQAYKDGKRDGRAEVWTKIGQETSDWNEISEWLQRIKKG